MGFLGNRDIFTSSDMTQHINSNVDKSSNSYRGLIENHNSDNILNSAVENIVFSHQGEKVRPPLNKYKGHVSSSEDKLNKATKNKIQRPYPDVNSHTVFKNISNLFISNTNTSLIFTSFAPEANVSTVTTIFSSNKMLDKTDKNRGKDHDHDLDHGDQFSCQPMSGQYRVYIENNLSLLKKQCYNFDACINELYSAENFHRVLAGDNIQLKNICGLLFKNNNHYDTLTDGQCLEVERAAIHNDLNDHLAVNLSNPPDNNSKVLWRRLRVCISRDSSVETQSGINSVCRLSESKDNAFLCGDHGVHKMVEEFLNHELQHLHCSCSAVQSINRVPDNSAGTTPYVTDGVRMGIIGGVALIILLLLSIIALMCFKHRAAKRRLMKHRLKFLPPARSDSRIYHEIGPCSRNLDRLQRDCLVPDTYGHLEQAPTLPKRDLMTCKKSNSSGSITVAAEDHQYLEPFLRQDAGDRVVYNTGRVKDGASNASVNPMSSNCTLSGNDADGTTDQPPVLSPGDEDVGCSVLSHCDLRPGESAPGDMMMDDVMSMPEKGECIDEPKYFELESIEVQ